MPTALQQATGEASRPAIGLEKKRARRSLRARAPGVLRGMGLEDLAKTESALAELAEKGMAPD